MPATDTSESFPAMLRRVLPLKPDVANFVDMFAADALLELPFAPPGFKTPLKGRDAIAAHLQMASNLIKLDDLAVSDVLAHETSDPEVTVVEYAGSGHGLATGEAYEQRYISVIRVQDGSIAHYKDYWNPIAVLRTIKGEDIMKAFAVG